MSQARLGFVLAPVILMVLLVAGCTASVAAPTEQVQPTVTATVTAATVPIGELAVVSFHVPTVT